MAASDPKWTALRWRKVVNKFKFRNRLAESKTENRARLPYSLPSAIFHEIISIISCCRQRE